MSRTGTLARLFGHVPEPAVQMHAQDMARAALADGDLVHVTSRRGSIVLPVQASAQQRPEPGLHRHALGRRVPGRARVAAPASRSAGVNALTTSAFCPDSKQPELKHAAVKILKAELPWPLLAVAWLPEDAGARRARALQRADAAPSPSPPACRSAASARGVLFRAAAHEAGARRAAGARSRRCSASAAADVLRYADRRRGQRRSDAAARERRRRRRRGSKASCWPATPRAEAWIKTLLQDDLPAAGLRPPAAVARRQAAGRRRRRAASRCAAAST